jgi:NADPH2:quinone reductase
MKALVCAALSDDLAGVALHDAPGPAPKDGEALVRVTAAGVNYPDYLMAQGKYQFRPEPPFIMGMEGCGRIEALGAGAQGFSIGEDVVFAARLGAFAQYVAVPIGALKPKPRSLTESQAASYSAAYLTAYVALKRRGALQAGETVLVHGAAGGVGLAAVDLALRFGARVIATASTQKKRDFLTAMGVSLALAPSGFRDAVKDVTQGRGADVIYDPVGGDVFDESVRCIAFGGRLLVIGFTSGRIATISANLPLIKGFAVVGVRAGEHGRQFPDQGRADAEAVWQMADRGEIRAHVGAEMKLDDGRAALLRLTQRDVIGKIVLRP